MSSNRAGARRAARTSDDRGIAFRSIPRNTREQRERLLTYTVSYALFNRQTLQRADDMVYDTGLELVFCCRHSLHLYWPFGCWTIWFGDLCIGRLLSCPSYTDCLAALAVWRGARRRGRMAVVLQDHGLTTDTLTAADLLTEHAEEDEEQPVHQPNTGRRLEAEESDDATDN